MSYTSSIDSLKQTTSDPYTAKASYDETNGFQTTEVTGDRTTGAFTKAAGGEMGKMQFLTLLTEQLKHQDPLEPQDNGEFVAQLAQFSQLESMSNVSTSMEALKKSFETSLAIQSNSAQSVTNSTSVSLIGREVRLRQKTFDWLGSGTGEFKVQMGTKREVTVRILDEKGNEITAKKITNKDETNAGSFTWDGTNINGQPVGEGTYTLKVDGEDQDSSIYCFVQDTVDGVRYTANGPVVKIAGQELPVGNILEVTPSSTSNTSNGLVDLSVGQAMTLIGKEVKYRDSGTSFAVGTATAGKSREYLIDMAGQTTATVILKDGEGNIAGQFIVEDKSGSGMGKLEIPMDDRNGTGGKYAVSISGNSNQFFYKQGEITGVIPTAAGVKLKVDGAEMSTKDILEVSI